MKGSGRKNRQSQVRFNGKWEGRHGCLSCARSQEVIWPHLPGSCLVQRRPAGRTWLSGQTTRILLASQDSVGEFPTNTKAGEKKKFCVCSCAEKPEVDVGVSLNNSPHYYFIIFLLPFYLCCVRAKAHHLEVRVQLSDVSSLSLHQLHPGDKTLFASRSPSCLPAGRPCCSSILFCETRSLTEPGTSQLPELAGQRTPGISSLSSPPHTHTLKLQTCTTMSSFYMGAQGLNSGPHALCNPACIPIAQEKQHFPQVPDRDEGLSEGKAGKAAPKAIA